MVENHTPIAIASENAERLAILSNLFCIKNNIPITPDLIPVLSNAVFEGITNWYAERGRTFDPKAERIEDDALIDAFARVQKIADLATLCAVVEKMGIEM